MGGGAAVGGGSGGGGQDGGVACPHPAPGSPDHARKLVVSHPDVADGGFAKDTRFEVFNLSPTGALTSTGQIFRMGVAGNSQSPIAFTPDGKIGIAAQDDGTLGVFRFDDTGAVTVVHAALAGSWYANFVLIDSTGAYAWVLDFNTPNNGGGIYKAAIGCDGTLTDLGLALAGDVPSVAAWLNTQPNKALIAARGLGNSPDAGNLHLVDFSTATPTVVASVAAFPDQDVQAQSVTVRLDDAWAGVTDTPPFGNGRFSLLRFDGGVPVPSTVTIADNPVGIAFSPFKDDALLITSIGSDSYRSLGLDGGVSAKLTLPNGNPGLPGASTMLTQGQLKGHFFIPEYNAVRHLAFEPDGGLVDVAKTVVPVSIGNVGTLGVAP